MIVLKISTTIQYQHFDRTEPFLSEGTWRFEDIFPVKRVYNFGGLILPGPNNFDNVLKGCGYGNYMEYPPADKRHTHLIEFSVLDSMD